jgi:hypothetical protein
MERSLASLGGLCAAFALAFASPCMSLAGGLDGSTVRVTIDQEAYRARDEAYRVERVEARIDRALHDDAAAQTVSGEHGLTVFGLDPTANAADIQRIRAYFANKPRFAVTTQPAEMIRIHYSPEGLRAFGENSPDYNGTPDASRQAYLNRLKDLRVLESYIRLLRPRLPVETPALLIQEMESTRSWSWVAKPFAGSLKTTLTRPLVSWWAVAAGATPGLAMSAEPTAAANTRLA